MDDIQARISRLLDELDNPGLTDLQIEKIQKKLQILSGLQS